MRNLSNEQFYSSFGIDKKRVESYLNCFVKNSVVNKKDFGLFKTLIMGTKDSDKTEIIYQWSCDFNTNKELRLCSASFTKVVETVDGCVTYCQKLSKIQKKIFLSFYHLAWVLMVFYIKLILTYNWPKILERLITRERKKRATINIFFFKK